MAITSANQLELLQTAEGVARVADGIGTLDGLVHSAGVAELGRIDSSEAAQHARALAGTLAVVYQEHKAIRDLLS